VRAIGAIDAAIADVSATLLARMHVGGPGDLDGRILSEILRTGAPLATDSALPLTAANRAAPNTVTESAARPTAVDTPLPPTAASDTPNAGRVEARLRRLGYIE
jgi:hypothetical protein